MSAPHADLVDANVLLVDDLPENLRVLKQSLEQDGLEISVASSGESAIKVAQNGHPDLILLDVQMPGMNGFETCRELKTDPDTSDIPVIFVTARAETEAVVEDAATPVETAPAVEEEAAPAEADTETVDRPDVPGEDAAELP